MDSNLMNNLHHISTGRLMMEFSEYYHQNYLNWEMRTLGGSFFWDTLYEIDGWKVQRHTLGNVSLPHYRILDPQNKRRCWSLTEDQFRDDLQRFVSELQVREQMSPHQYGIVFSGGGAKGAYQIGVWQYLRDLGIDRKFSIISGASVGALNSLLFAQEDFDKALEAWLTFRREDLLYLDLHTILKSTIQLIQTVASPSSAILKALTDITMSHSEKNEWLGFFSSQARLRDTISRFVDPNKVTHSSKLVFSSLTQLPSFKPYYVCWKVLNSFEDIQNLVLASAALPLVYPARYFDKRLCIDGGVKDNLPISKLARMCDAILVIHLTPEWVSSEQKHWIKSFGKLHDSRARIYHIYPSTAENMSGVSDLINISPELTQWRIKLGYQDAKRQLCQFLCEL